MKGSAVALSIALALLPFSILLCHMALACFLWFWMLESSWVEKLAQFRRNTDIQVLAALLVIMLFGLLYTDDTYRAEFFVQRKAFFFLLPLAIATSANPLRTAEIRRMFYLFVGACFVAMCVCLVHAFNQYQIFRQLGPEFTPSIFSFDIDAFNQLNPAADVQWLFFSYRALSAGIAIHPAYLALYFAFCSLFLLHEFLTRALTDRQATVVGTLIILFTLFVALLSNRTILYSLFALYTIVAAAIVLRFRTRRAVILLSVLAIAIATLFYINPVSQYRNWQEFHAIANVPQGKQIDNSIEERASQWDVAWQTFLKSPLLGVGTADVKKEMQNTAGNYHVADQATIADPHNEYLYLMVGNGIVALVLFLLYLLMAFFRGWASGNYLAIGFIFLVAALCFTESALERQKGIVFFSIIYPVLSFQWTWQRAQHLTGLSSARS